MKRRTFLKALVAATMAPIATVKALAPVAAVKTIATPKLFWGGVITHEAIDESDRLSSGIMTSGKDLWPGIEKHYKERYDDFPKLI